MDSFLDESGVGTRESFRLCVQFSTVVTAGSVWRERKEGGSSVWVCEVVRRGGKEGRREGGREGGSEWSGERGGGSEWSGEEGRVRERNRERELSVRERERERGEI